MSTTRTSVAVAAATADLLRVNVDRPDGQEDICLATYRPSTGITRRTALITSVIEPQPGERHVHGNASIEGEYVLRAAAVAYQRGDGLVLCHSHPGARGWQSMSGPDWDAEASFANLVRELTGHPLVGMTYAGADDAWSARHWDVGTGTDVKPTHSENVRVIGEVFTITWNDDLVPVGCTSRSQHRSVSCWGGNVQANLARRSVLVVGLGSVGLDVALRLVATGIINVGIMDFDSVEIGNLDRLIGATAMDAALGRSKIDVARRLMAAAATASNPNIGLFDCSISEPEGLTAALDYDEIVCCVDRPWARAVLNQIAYTDLIPVVDGGIAIDVFSDGDGMRNATWRSHVVRPGRPCLACNGQLDMGEVAVDIQGLLDDPTYIAGAGRQRGAGQNVSLLSISAAATLLAQFVSFNVAPGGVGDPGPLQYLFSTHTLEHLPAVTRTGCPFEASEAAGDARQSLTGDHPTAEAHRRSQTWRGGPGWWPRMTDRMATRLRARADRLILKNMPGPQVQQKGSREGAA